VVRSWSPSCDYRDYRAHRATIAAPRALLPPTHARWSQPRLVLPAHSHKIRSPHLPWARLAWAEMEVMSRQLIISLARRARAADTIYFSSSLRPWEFLSARDLFALNALHAHSVFPRTLQQRGKDRFLEWKNIEITN
jgi:hypothetical protein